MRKIIYILTILLGLNSCSKEKFDYSLYEPTASEIDSIYFSTGSPTLIADGKASLQFVIEAFRKVQLKNEDGNLVDTMLQVDYTSLPKEEVRVYANGELLKDLEYKTESAEGTLQFYAEIGAIKSDVKSVLLREAKDVGQKRFVDVVFHVFELSTTDAAYDPLTYQPIEQRHLEEAIDYANAVFNNVYGKDPNGGNAKIEFRLASKNQNGGNLAQKGYNRIQYDSSWKSSATALNFSLINFSDRINAMANYQWDKDKFLNIYILPFAGNSAIGSPRAAYQIVPEGESPLEGITHTVNKVEDVPQTDFFNTYGLGIHRTMFFPGTDRKIEIASYLGIYYGLYPTYSALTTATTVIDYVEDTRKYLSGSNQTANQVRNLLKTGLDGEKFLANNALDELRFASLRNCFTQGQIERMRLVMDWSPVRKAWTLQ